MRENQPTTRGFGARLLRHTPSADLYPYQLGTAARGAVLNPGQPKNRLLSTQEIALLLSASEPVEEGLRVGVRPRRAASEHDLPR
eukprot:scaffold54878_cov67-Phaeocystis_antarctica.AAC.5